MSGGATGADDQADGTVGGRRHRSPCAHREVPEWVVPISVPTPYPIGPVTAYLLRGDPLTLIDTGPATRSAWCALERGLHGAGCRPEQLRRVLLTHGHHDHYGQARRLQEGGAEVIAHPDETGNLMQDRRFGVLWRQLSLAGLPLRTRLALVGGLAALDTTARSLRRFTPIGDGATIDHEHGRLKVHHLPGHSPGHLGFELADAGLVWTGDILLEGITPNAVVGPDPCDPRRPFLSIAAYNRSLERISVLRPRLLLPGHGPCIDDVGGAISRVMHRQQQRSRQVGRLLERGPANASHLVQLLFPGLSPVETFLAFSEVYGHLLELERQGAVVRARSRGREKWLAARPR